MRVVRVGRARECGTGPRVGQGIGLGQAEENDRAGKHTLSRFANVNASAQISARALSPLKDPTPRALLSRLSTMHCADLRFCARTCAMTDAIPKTVLFALYAASFSPSLSLSLSLSSLSLSPRTLRELIDGRARAVGGVQNVTIENVIGTCVGKSRASHVLFRRISLHNVFRLSTARACAWQRRSPEAAPSCLCAPRQLVLSVPIGKNRLIWKHWPSLLPTGLSSA